MFRASSCSSSGAECRNCIYATSGIATLCRFFVVKCFVFNIRVTIFSAQIFLYTAAYKRHSSRCISYVYISGAFLTDCLPKYKFFQLVRSNNNAFRLRVREFLTVLTAFCRKLYYSRYRVTFNSISYARLVFNVVTIRVKILYPIK